MKKRFMSRAMKILLPLLLLFSIGSFITSSVMLYKSDYKLTNYTQFEEFLYDIFGHDYLYFKNWLNTGNYESPLNQSFSLNNVNTIILDFPNSYVDITTGYNSNIEFDCLSFDNPSNVISNNLLDGTLTIAENATSTNDNKYSITIPEHFNGNLSIKSKSGNINISNVSINSLTISSYDATINLINILSKDVSVSNTNENIYTDNVTADNFKLTNSNGNINISNTSSNLDIKNSRGEVRLSELKNSNYTISTDTGNVDIDLDDNNKFNFNFTTKSGLLQNHLNIDEFILEKQNNTEIIKMNSAYNNINITTNSGNLEILKDF